MNNTLLILGNGFDLSFGLKTSYGAFMQSQYFKEFAANSYLGQYLKDEQEHCHTWIDIEKELSKFCLKINSGGVMIPMKQYEPDGLLQEYELLKDSLKSYLKNELKQTKPSFFDSKVVKLVRNMRDGDNNMIATFNYTDVAEKILENSFSQVPKKVIHVHGSLADNDDIVFGVEDEIVLPKKYAFLYKAYSKYKKTKWFALYLSMARNIVFYGYSLGDTDKQYFADFLCDLCRIRKDNRKIIFYHYEDQGYLDLKWQLMNFTNKQLSALEMYNDVQYRDCSKEDCNFYF